MEFNYSHYVPCLRWKMGEYQAVCRLSDAAKNRMTPLIEVPEESYDFEKRELAKTLDDHLEPFARRVRQNWRRRGCFVDLNLIGESSRMAGGIHPLEYVFSALREEKCAAVPVTGISRDAAYRDVVCQVVSTDRVGACFRISVEQAAKADLQRQVDKLLMDTGIRENECDLVLDLVAPNFEPLSGLCKVLKAIVARLPYLSDWRTLTILGTSFPRSMAEVKGSAEIVRRCEWLLYRMLVSALHDDDMRVPTFGDYAISHPAVLQMDWRLVKPLASIRYTIDDAWYVVKGLNVRDHKFGQYRELCRNVLESGHYCGAGFSAGDAYISDCSRGAKSTGNLTVWRRVGTNHHLEKVTRDIASLSFS